MIRNWKRQFELSGIDVLVSKEKGRQSMKKVTQKTRPKKPVPAEGTLEALQAKIERLELENAYLKS